MSLDRQVNALHERAKLAWSRGQHEDAFDALSAALRLDPSTHQPPATSLQHSHRSAGSRPVISTLAQIERWIGDIEHVTPTRDLTFKPSQYAPR